jgi:hypothetical protein
MRHLSSLPFAVGRVLGFSIAVGLIGAPSVFAAPKSKQAGASESGRKSGKEISTDDRALDKQMDWEAKVLGPNTQKKIDLQKIQKLQAEELARREKQERIDQAEKDRKDREAAAAAAAQRNTKAPSTRDVPALEETPILTKPVEKHDDAFVDKLLTGKGEKKKVTVSNDEVDQLLNKAKQEKGASITPNRAGKAKGGDTVDQLLATADKQAPIKTTTRKPNDAEPVSAEAAARESALKSVAAAAAAKEQDERFRNKKPMVPDAAILRAQAGARTSAPEPARPAPAPAAAPTRAGWTDPFASDTGSVGSTSLPRNHSKVSTTTVTPPPLPRSTSGAASGRHSPVTRPSGSDRWQDPFDSGSGAKPRPAPSKTAPATHPTKRPPNWKDPFA